MWLGSLRLDLVPGGRARLDGKTLFGVVPERLWERRFPADASGRVTVASNLLLIRSPDLTVLVQAGPGGSSLAPALAQHGVAAEEVTALVLSNLHVDHAGGAAIHGGGASARAFPRARLIVQEAALECARRPPERERGSYRAECFEPYAEAGALTAVSGEAAVRPGITVVPLPGHAPGMQAVRIESGGQTAFYFSDALPTAAHVPLPWSMEYESYPVALLADKKRLLNRAAAERWLCVFERDPDIPWGTIVDEVNGKRRVHVVPSDADAF